jgi:macrolide transport system ATP-binding/permease protein
MPDWSADLRHRLASLRLSPARAEEIVEELSQHLDLRYDELRAAGARDADARRLALEELLEADALANRMRWLRQAHEPATLAPGAPRRARALWGDLSQDLRYAARMLRKQPGFAAAVVLTLALGIGANTAIFSLVNSTLLRQLPVPNRDRLVYVHRGNVGGVFSYPMYERLRDDNHVFDGTAAWGGITASLNADNTTDLVSGCIVTGNLFELLGITAAHGRLLSASDDVTPGKHPVAVISHSFWQTRFAGRPDIIGHDIRLNGHPFTIVGVTRAGFPGPLVGSVRHLYVPMMMQAIMRPPRAGYSGEQNPDLLKNPNNGWLLVLGRLKPGMAAAQASAELATIATTFVRTANPSAQPLRMIVLPIDRSDPNQREQMFSVALLLGGVVGAVLLIACANVANLLLSRTASRRRELAVRLAIGASRARLVRQLLTESVLLSLIGGAVGLGLAWIAVESFVAAPPPPGALPLAIDFAIDRRVLWFSVGLSCVTGLLFGVVPALNASRPGLVPALKDASSDVHEPARRFNFKKALVVAEVGLSLPLLIAAGLFVRSLLSAQTIDPGFDAARLVSAPLNINLLRYTRVQGREFYRTVVDRMERLPGVEAASTSRVSVMTGGGRVLSLLLEGREGSTGVSMSEGGRVATVDPTLINANVVGPGFFETLGIPFVTGRDFTDQDAEGRPPVVIVNETTRRMHFSGESPLGRRVSFGGQQGPWREIVGVVRDSKYGSLGEAALPVAYLPVSQNHETGMTLYVRASVPPASLVAAIRREIQAIEPNLPVPDIRTMEQTIGTSLYAARMGAWLLTAFGGLAVLLAAVGIYGVLSFSISRRTREMGIRMALGASRRNVFLLVVRDGMLAVAVGIVCGLLAAFAAVRSLARFLYEVPTADAVTFGATTTVLVAVALLACMIPARRAMRVAPIDAIRSE